MTSAPGTAPWQWFYGFGRHPDIWFIAESRDDAIAKAREPRDESNFSICEAQQDPAKLTCRVFGALMIERLIEDFGDANEEHWSEDGQPQWSTEDGLTDALNAAFEAWFAEKRPVKPFAFTATRNDEYFGEEQEL